MKSFCLFCLLFFLITTAFLCRPLTLAAEETVCIAAYNNMSNLLEKGNAAAGVCNYCRSVFLLKQALDWLGKCETECVANKEKMIRIRQYKPDLIKALEIYGMRCGR
jgi:hypothetical protein